MTNKHKLVKEFANKAEINVVEFVEDVNSKTSINEKLEVVEVAMNIIISNEVSEMNTRIESAKKLASAISKQIAKES